MSSIEAQVKEVIAETSRRRPEDIRNDATLSEDLSLDSMNAVEIVTILEERCQVEISDQAAEGFKRVQDVIDYITARKQ
ncbi:acyl carrier protein [Streptomyces sp. NPDC088097]|uniref:acyl carrier protein n=1 Tax=Streptomyces sp. NPDC088097 TaxID=3365823 RepID=UPI003823E69D